MPALIGKFWIWVLNNPTDEEMNRFCHWSEELEQSPNNHPDLRFIVFQKERGEEGTPHLQGYLELKQRKTLNQVKRILQTNTVHLELRRGTAEQAIAYCTKEDTRVEGPWEGGSVSTGQGTRTDLATIRERIRAGASDQEIADEFFGSWCRYNKAFQKYRSIITPKRNWRTEVTVIVGPPGTGKSRKAYDEWPDGYWKQRSVWWDTYENQKNVVIDDFYGWIPYDVLLRVCDRYPLLVETKGSQANFVAEKIVITSNQPPTKWYKRGDLRALIRRVDRWIYMGHNETLDTNSYAEFIDCFNRHELPALVEGFNPQPQEQWIDLDLFR